MMNNKIIKNFIYNKIMQTKKVEKSILFFLSICIIIVLVPFITKAACPSDPDTIPNPIRACSFADLIRDLTQIILIIGLPLSALMIIFSGFKFVTAGGNEEQLKKARSMFFWTIIGTAVIIGARVIAEAVVNFAKDLG